MKAICICFVVLVMFMDLGHAGPARKCKCAYHPSETEPCCKTGNPKWFNAHGTWTGEHCEFPEHPEGGWADCCKGGGECKEL